MICIPFPVEELETQTSNSTVEDDAINETKELFSIEPQKAASSAGQLQSVYAPEVLPQYPLISQINGTLVMLSVATGCPPQGGCAKMRVTDSNANKSINVEVFIL
jgi:hypothetical protein